MSDVDEALASLATGPATIEHALAATRAGRMLVLAADDGSGELMIAAEHVTAEAIAFMTRQGGGWIRLALSAERCDELQLPLMASGERAGGAGGDRFTVTIEAREGVSTGISAPDQAHTMRTAVDPARGRDQLTIPGHVQPLRAALGGVLEHPGSAEAAVDLAALAGLLPAGVICQVQTDDGALAGPSELSAYCARHGLPLLRIADLVAHHRRRQPRVKRVAAARMPTAFGVFTAIGFRGTEDGAEHLALVKGDLSGGDVPVHIQPACLTGTAFHTLHCSCGERLDAALAAIEAAGRGVVIHLAGGGLIDELRRHRCGGSDDQAIAAEILAALGVGSTVHVLGAAPERPAPRLLQAV